MEKIVSYKGFDKDFKCLDMQYEVGKTYTMDGKIEACSRGYHACKEAKHVFRYYPPSKSRYAVVEQSGILSTHKTDSKVASSSITVVRELSLQEFLSIIITQQGEGESAACSTGDYGAASSTGEYGAASSTGYCGKVMGSLGNALFLVERTPSGEISFAWAGIVGESGIKPNVWYSLKDGVPVEV